MEKPFTTKERYLFDQTVAYKDHLIIPVQVDFMYPDRSVKVAFSYATIDDHLEAAQEMDQFLSLDAAIAVAQKSIDYCEISIKFSFDCFA